MDLTNTILNNIVKQYSSNKIELLQNTTNLKNILNENLPSFIDTEDFLKQILPKSSEVITSQKVSLTLTQLNNELKPVEDTQIEVNSICIEDIELDMLACGFTGKAEINLPYATAVPDSYAILFENQPLRVELEITTEYRHDQTNPEPKEKSINNVLKLTGITSFKKGIKHQHHFSENDQQAYESKKPFFNAYVTAYIEFNDVLQALWREHYPVCIYQDRSYQDAFDFQNRTYDSLVKINYDGTEKLLSAQRPFIAINCDYQKQYSFYDFLISVLYDYGLSLIYDYTKEEYNIVNAKTWLDKLTKIELDTKKMIRLSQVDITSSKPSRNMQLFDTNYDLGKSLEKPSELNALWNEKSSGLPNIYSSYLTTLGIEDIAESIKEAQCIYKQYIYNDLAGEANSSIISPVRIHSDIAPFYDCPLQPISLVKFSEKINGLTFMQKGFPELLVMHTHFKIKPTPLWACVRKEWSATQEHMTNDDKHDLSRTMHANDNITTRPALLFNYEVKQSFSFKDNISMILPRTVKSQPDLTVISEIYTTSDDETKKNHNHLLFDMYENEITATSAGQKNTLYSAEIPNSPFAQSYLCKFPKTLLPPVEKPEPSPTTEGKPFLMPINIQECNMNPNFYTLLKSGTQILLTVQRENTYLNKVLNYQTPEQEYCKGDAEQNHYINFENREECKAYISHKFDLSSNATSLNIESTQPDKARSIVLSDNGLKMKYQLKEK